MGDKKVTLRVQAREGTKRFDVSLNENTTSLYEKVKDGFGFTGYAFKLHKDKKKEQKDLVSSSKSSTIGQHKLRHGDLLFLTPEEGMSLTPSDDDVMMDTSHELPRSSSSSSRSLSAALIPDVPAVDRKFIPEDEIDVVLSTQDGKIKRKKDSKFCQHGENSGCIHCSPLEPYNEGYLKEQNIKHLSFHSHLRKMTGGMDRGKFVALEDLSVRIKEGCKKHLPWPEGICTMCQPSAVTLNRQTYRHVDNVQFENPQIVESFISYWRNTGYQRMGLLYGTYEQLSDVPLGIRTRVAAIYEPPQENSRDLVKFDIHNEKISAVNDIAKSLGLRCVGWIFTDLVAEDVSKGTVKSIRGINSFFMSAQECITAAYLQTLHPNPSKHSPSGYFGSKFATVIITGDDQNQVHMEGYQVSNQCMALVRDNVLVPTKDAPELGYVRETSKQQYVPDVFFKQKDEYGNEVQRLARPLPVEYLLVNVPVSTPKEPQFSFRVDDRKFPIENRRGLEVQDLNALGAYLAKFDRNTPFLEIACDFHFLVYIATMELFPMAENILPLLEAIKSADEGKAAAWSQSEHWATVEQILQAAGPGGAAAGGPFGANPQDLEGGQAAWNCSACTFLNQGTRASCEICAVPRQ